MIFIEGCVFYSKIKENELSTSRLLLNIAISIFNQHLMYLEKLINNTQYDVDKSLLRIYSIETRTDEQFDTDLQK